MEYYQEQNVANEDGNIESGVNGVSRAELQRAHTRVAARLGDVAASDRDTVVMGPQPADQA